MLNIYLNDELYPLPEKQTIADLLAQKTYPKDAFAVALNNRHILRKDYQSTALNDGDRVDIIVAMQGG